MGQLSAIDCLGRHAVHNRAQLVLELPPILVLEGVDKLGGVGV